MSHYKIKDPELIEDIKLITEKIETHQVQHVLIVGAAGSGSLIAGLLARHLQTSSLGAEIKIDFSVGVPAVTESQSGIHQDFVLSPQAQHSKTLVVIIDDLTLG